MCQFYDPFKNGHSEKKKDKKRVLDSLLSFMGIIGGVYKLFLKHLNSEKLNSFSIHSLNS